jgi:subfamily B ATP-binding cassette protein HlyB/CyaB
MPRGDSELQLDMPAAQARESQAPPQPLALDDLLWLAGSICRLLGVAFDSSLARRHVTPPLDLGSLNDLLVGLGFAAQFEPRIGNHLPAVAMLEPLDGGQSVPVLVVRVAVNSVDFFPTARTWPESVAPREFAARLRGPVVAVRVPVAEPRDADAAGHGPSFGFRWFVPEVLRHRAIWRDVLLASLAIQLLALGLPLMTQAIVDKVIVHRTESTLIALGSGLALFALVSAALTWGRQYLVLHTGTRIDAVLGAAVFRHLVELPPRYFEQRPTGVIAARLHGVEQIREFLSSAAVALVLDLPFLSLCLAMMFVYSLPLALLALAFLGSIVIVGLAVSPVFQSRLNREFLAGARTQAFVTEYVAGIETVKSLQMEPVVKRRFGDYLAAQLGAAFATRQAGNCYQVVVGTLEQTMTLAILVFGAWLAMQPHADAGDVLTIGMLVAFQMFANKLSQPLLRLAGLWQQFQQAHLAVRRLGDLMNAIAEPYAVAPKRPSDVTGPASDIPLVLFESVAFRYGEDRVYLYDGLDLSIRVGECVALVGPSGCGKSTLAKLLQGFCFPSRGRILIDGVDTRHLCANELRATFGVVPQETVLFSGTVLDNLLLASPHADMASVVRACQRAGIHRTIEALPDGYRTELGERGAGLSGGQKQRIAIARALLKQPRMLIFDEATSHLDATTTAGLAVTVEALRGSVAILFITHAPIASVRFDRVVRLG